MRAVAERVLFATTLEEKLRPGPVVAGDEAPGRAIGLPAAPGRPAELRMGGHGGRVEFPGIHRIDDERERGVLLHFLANHELLAAELMALVLLRFPDAPRAYRAGVYAALREEQAHALMYVRRMRECGVVFGELPLNDHFWRLVAPMPTPLDFVTRLNLTFEQANLDFSKHYAGVFREAGDHATAAVLEKIHLDEIGHVGHGLKWFREWKQPGVGDWEAYCRQLPFPLTAARAKGLAPFNAASRRLAGLDEDFIQRLEGFEHSRGRTPVLHWFNPNAEAHARAAAAGTRHTPDKAEVALEHDLELLMLGCCRRDDALLVRELPEPAHLVRLKRAGFVLPEIQRVGTPGGRKLSGLRPWAWSPDAAAQLEPVAADVAASSAEPWRAPLPHAWFSKELGLRLEAQLGGFPETGQLCRDAQGAEAAVAGMLAGGGQALLKAPYACAGRGHLRVNHASDAARTRGWIANTLGGHGGVVVERWLDRVLDFSALYQAHADGRIELLALTQMENDAAGRFVGIRVGGKWGSGLDPELAEFLFREARVMDWYQEKVPAALATVLAGYAGPLCVDAMVHRGADGRLALKPVVEVNVRFSMGRIAWEWLQQLGGQRAGRLRILRRQQLDAGQLEELAAGPGMFLNDPGRARQFLAYLEW